jgi:hypothetical protein
MESMNPNISPESVQPNLGRRSPRSSHFKHTGSNPQTDIGGDNLHTGHPLGNLSTFPGSESSLVGLVAGIQPGELIPRTIGQCFGGTKMSKEVTISFKDIELIRWRILVVTPERPGARRGRSVLGGEVQRTESNP